MSRTLLLLFTLTACLLLPQVETAAQAPADATPPEPSLEQIDALIADLGAPTRLDRERATRELAQIGAPAIPALEQAVGSSDAEVRRRAGELLETLRAEAACTPTLVDVDWKTIPVRLAVKQLAEKTGLPFQLQLPQGRRGGVRYSRWITLQGRDIPLLKVLDHLCRVGSLQIHWPPRPDNPILLAPGPASGYPASYEGPFAVRLRELELTRRYRFSAPASRFSTLQLQFDVIAEPRVTLLANQPLVLTEAVDANGHSLNLKRARSTSRFTQPPMWGIRSPVRSSGFNATAHLQLTDEPGARLETLAGEVTVDLLIGRDRALVIEDLEHATGRDYNVEGATLQIESVDETDGQLDIALVLQQTRSLPGNYASAFFNDSFEIVDRAGDTVATNVTAAPNPRIRPQAATTRLRLSAKVAENQEGPWRLLIYRAHKHSYTIPFRFNDVPLP